LPSTFALSGPQFKERGWTFLAGQEGYCFRWEQFRAGMRDFTLGEHQFDDFFSEEIPPETSEFIFTEIYSCFDRSCKKRRFMTTANEYMGWAPENIYATGSEQTQEGDLIAIIFGCNTPLAIRPHGDQFQVLGDAYIQGLMDGSLMLPPTGLHRSQGRRLTADTITMMSSGVVCLQLHTSAVFRRLLSSPRALLPFLS
jgi:hypothetical protein